MQGGSSMTGGHVGSMLAEGKMNQENSAAKSGKILTELASNSYMGDMGNEEAGRKEENDMLGIGKKWAKETAKGNDIKIMSHEQDNAAANAIGGIEATHAELMKHKKKGLNTVDSAIMDMVTAGEEKGTASAAHADKMREEFGSHLNKKSKKTENTLKDEIEKAKKDKEDAENESTRLGARDDLSFEEKNRMAKGLTAKKENAEKRIASGEKLLKTMGDGMTLRDVNSNIEESKIQSMVGQAAGVKENINKNPAMYAQNAMYSEESRQQTTDQKIKTQGGVASAVTSDVNESALKAAKQQKGTQAEIQEQAFKILKNSNPNASKDELNESASKIAKAIMSGGDNLSANLKDVIGNSKIKVDDSLKVSDMSQMVTAGAGALAGQMTAGKTIKDIQSVDKANTKDNPNGYIDAKRREGASAGTQDAKQNALVDSKKATQSIIDKEMAQQRHLEKTHNQKGLVDKYLKAAAKSGLIETNEDGSVKIDPKTNKPIATTGDKFAMGRAAASANNALMENAVNVGGTVFRESFNADGEGTVSASLGDNSTYNELHKDDSGAVVNTNLTKAKNRKQANAMEIGDLVTDPKKAAKLLFGKTYDGVKSTLEDNGFSSESASTMANVFSYGTAGVVALGSTAAVAETLQRGYNLVTGEREPIIGKDGKPVFDTSKPIENANGDRQFTDANNQKVFQDKDTGSYYTQGKDEAEKPYTGKKLTPSYEPKTRVARGVAGKVAGGAWSGLKSGAIKTNEFLFGESSSPIKDGTTDSTTNPSDYGDEEQRETKENNSGQHPESPNTKSKKETNPFSKNSVPNSRESVKDIEKPK